jgi:hypothetical protein
MMLNVQIRILNDSMYIRTVYLYKQTVWPYLLGYLSVYLPVLKTGETVL